MKELSDYFLFKNNPQEQFLQKLEQSLKNLRVVDVELFITSARMNHLGKAATFHHLSQSAASTAICRVEAAFGSTLCTHEKRRFCLTREGQVLLPRLESWIKRLRELVVSQDQIPLRLVTTHAIAQIAAPAVLSLDLIDFQHMRPDRAYAAILQGRADIALVLDNAPWKGVLATELGCGHFRLYAKCPSAPLKSVLLPEEQIEVLALQQTWFDTHGYPLAVKSRIPSWSLIAQICAESEEIGFLPDFLARKFSLSPVPWQPALSSYRLLAIHRQDEALQERFDRLIEALRKVFEVSF